MKRLLYILSLCMLLYGPAEAKTITVDGNISDWADVPVLVADPAGDSPGGSGWDVRSIKVTSDAQNFYYLLSYDPSSLPFTMHTHLAIDTDSNISTGCRPIFGIGAELQLQLNPGYPGLSIATLYLDCSGSQESTVSLPSIWVSVGSTVYIEGSIPRVYFPNSTFTLQTGYDSLPAPVTVTLPSAVPPNAAPAFSLSSPTLPFSTISTNTQSTAQAITLSNGGNVPLTFFAPLILGSHPGDFVLAPGSTCLPGPLAVGSSCSFYITFFPTAEGPRTASIAFNALSVPMQSVSLTGTGGALLTSASKIDKKISKRCDPNDSPLTEILEKGRCKQIEVLRTLFSTSLAKVDNDTLYNWLGVSENREFVTNLQKKIAFGQMAEKFAHGNGPWDDGNGFYKDVKNLSKEALKLEKLIGSFILQGSKAFRFMSNALTVKGFIDKYYGAYKAGLSALVANAPSNILLDYQNTRNTSPDDPGPAQLDIKVSSGFDHRIYDMICEQKNFGGKCINGEPTSEQWDAFFSALEEAYQAMRLAGPETNQDSQGLRTALGEAIAKAITGP